jgi:hypothetical protein
MLQQVKRFHRRLRNAFQDLRIARMYARAGVHTRQPTQDERRLLFTVTDLVNAGYPLAFDKEIERWVARSYPDGALEVRCSYEPVDALPGHLRFMLVTRITRAPSISNATELFRNAIDWSAAGAATKGGRFVFKGNLQAWCENAHVAFTLAEPNDTVVGCRLSFQRENMVYIILIRGVILEEEREIEQLVYPFLESGLRWCAGEA